MDISVKPLLVYPCHHYSLPFWILIHCLSCHCILCSYVMGIGEAEAFSERLKRELQALEAANVHAILESEPLIDEVIL